MALFRADLVDGLLAEAAINTIVGTNVFPIVFTFEDMLKYIDALRQQVYKQNEFNKSLQKEIDTLKSKQEKKD